MKNETRTGKRWQYDDFFDLYGDNNNSEEAFMQNEPYIDHLEAENERLESEWRKQEHAFCGYELNIKELHEELDTAYSKLVILREALEYYAKNKHTKLTQVSPHLDWPDAFLCVEGYPGQKAETALKECFEP